MFERYTERARRVLFFARYEASSFGSEYIEPEHLLLAIFREEKAIHNLAGVQGAENIRKQIETRRGPNATKSATSVDIPLSPPSKRILSHSALESDRLNHRYIETFHLALGILSERDSFAAGLLNQPGIDADKLIAACDVEPLARTGLPLSLYQHIRDLAEEEARTLNRLPGPEHLLLALLRSENSLAATLLKEKGFTLEGLRDEIRRRYAPQL